jgi:hypothetical protein
LSHLEYKASTSVWVCITLVFWRSCAGQHIMYASSRLKAQDEHTHCKCTIATQNKQKKRKQCTVHVVHTECTGRPEENSISGLPIIFITEVHTILW